ncbi:MAG: extracellular solute-binding protein [Deltaproteobacteria bacterium]|nr:extracellular solute-binding protein [Deltaproteobacteria bacterium]
MNAATSIRAALLAVGLLAALLPSCRDGGGGQAAPSPEIRVLTDRTASHLQKLFDEYSKQTGVRVVANFVDEELLARLESRPAEADLIVVKEAHLLESAKRQGLLQPFSSKIVELNVPAAFRDPAAHYAVLSYRARVVYYSKDRVAPPDLSTYLGLADPKWKGRICLRSGFHDYNVGLFSQLATIHGLPRIETFLQGLRDNLARAPQGDDRDQMRAIAEGKCDLALANSYYMGIMLGREDQRAWAQATHVFFPDQAERGALLMRSCAALTRAGRHTKQATALLEFLTGDYAQRYFAEALLEYPVKAGVGIAPVNKALGREQGIENGAFKADHVSLTQAADLREKVIAALARLDFDRKGQK